MFGVNLAPGCFSCINIILRSFDLNFNCKSTTISGSLLKYFGASSATGQEEPPTSPATHDSAGIVSEPQDEDQPSTSSATQASSGMVLQDELPSISSATQISDIEDEDFFACTFSKRLNLWPCLIPL